MRFQILTFNDVGERENFVRYLKSFIAQESLHLDIQEHSLRCRELFATAVTREDRQQQLEKFFKAAFARVSNNDSDDDDDDDEVVVMMTMIVVVMMMTMIVVVMMMTMM